MRKSQIISLIILLVGVTVTIWIGALAGNNRGGEAKPSPTATGESATDVPSTPAPTEVPAESDPANLPADTILWSPSVSEGRFSPNVDGDILTQMAKYDCYYDGSAFGDGGAYLTFDISYGDPDDIKNIGIVLDALRAANVKGIFFLTNEFFKGQVTDIVNRIINEGHLLGNRGKIVSGNDMTKMSIAEYRAALAENEASLKAIVGDSVKMKYYRPLGNRFSIRDLAIAQQMGYKTLMFTSLYAREGLDNLSERMRTEVIDNAVYDIMIYAVDGQSERLSSAISETAGRITIKQLPS